MIIEEIKSIKSTEKDLRRFGITVGIGVALAGGLFWRQGRDFYLYFFGVSVVLLFLGLAAPRILKPFQKVWMSMAVLMGWVMTMMILAVFYYLVITPIGVLMRMFGKDILNRKIDRKMQSYWVTAETGSCDKTRYENQF